MVAKGDKGGGGSNIGGRPVTYFLNGSLRFVNRSVYHISFETSSYVEFLLPMLEIGLRF